MLTIHFVASMFLEDFNSKKFRKQQDYVFHLYVQKLCEVLIQEV